MPRLDRTLRGLARFGAGLARGARLMVGLPDYATYLAHMRAAHPEQAPMDRAAFCVERMQARYRRGGTRCC